MLRQGALNEAEGALVKALQLKQQINDNVGVPEILDWLGELKEAQHDYDSADKCYRQVLDNYRWTQMHHFECEALLAWPDSDMLRTN